MPVIRLPEMTVLSVWTVEVGRVRANAGSELDDHHELVNSVIEATPGH